MIWPPVKAWTSKSSINGQAHFVAINYGGELLSRWVVLMSVLDSSLVLEVSWAQLVDSSNWKSGWNETNHLESCESVNNLDYVKTSELSHPSIDSGLTIPIYKNTIRPWFSEN